MKKLLFVLTIVIVFLSFNVSAKCRKYCDVKYETQYGWSKKYTVNVTFLTGMELNDATSSYRYNSYAIYAVIFWGDGQSIIKLSNYLVCGAELHCKCLDLYFDLNGTDANGTEWKICTAYCY